MYLQEDQWRRLEPLLLGKKGDPGLHGHNNRLFVEAVLWQARHQRRWSDLPSYLGNWSAAYKRFGRWYECGFWHQLLEKLRGDPELRAVIEKIASYGDQRIKRTLLRAAQKNGRENFNQRAWQVGNVGSSLSSADDANLHWLSLVSDGGKL